MSEPEFSDIPLPKRKATFEPAKGFREGERLSAGAYFAENKALVDARRGPLARLGMDPRHVQALRMPTTADEPLAVMGQPALALPIEAVAVEDQPLTGLSPKRLPRDLEEAL